MYAKLKISGTIEVLTGMHIGGNSSFSAIGAIDSEVLRDPLSGVPVVPGSTLKGKMRTLLAKAYNRVVGSHDQDDERILNLFGCGSQADKVRNSRVIFADCVMDEESLRKKGVEISTEIKFENTINRLTAVANPRQIERVIRGAEFPLEVIYEVRFDDNEALDSTIEDMRLLGEGFRLLEYDYLGGHGSRGYGKVKFNNLQLDPVFGNLDADFMELCRDAFKEGKEGNA